MAQKNYVLVKNELKANSADQFAADPNLLWGAVRSYKHGEQADAFLDGLRQKSRVVDESDLSNVFRIFAAPQRTSALLAPPPAYANLSSTLPARKWLISLETGSKSQTTKRVW